MLWFYMQVLKILQKYNGRFVKVLIISDQMNKKVWTGLTNPNDEVCSGSGCYNKFIWDSDGSIQDNGDIATSISGDDGSYSCLYVDDSGNIGPAKCSYIILSPYRAVCQSDCTLPSKRL